MDKTFSFVQKVDWHKFMQNPIKWNNFSYHEVSFNCSTLEKNQ